MQLDNFHCKLQNSTVKSFRWILSLEALVWKELRGNKKYISNTFNEDDLTLLHSLREVACSQITGKIFLGREREN